MYIEKAGSQKVMWCAVDRSGFKVVNLDTLLHEFCSVQDGTKEQLCKAEAMVFHNSNCPRDTHEALHIVKYRAQEAKI